MGGIRAINQRLVGKPYLRYQNLCKRHTLMLTKYVNEQIEEDLKIPQCPSCGNYTSRIVRTTKICLKCHNTLLLPTVKQKKKLEGEAALISIIKRRIVGALHADLKRARFSERPNLTMSYLLALFYKQKGRCAITGRKLSLAPAEGGKAHPNAISLDRIDSNRPHVVGNVRFVIFQANLAKGPWSDAQLLEFCIDTIENFRDKSTDRDK
jgi:hypothetical protein